MNYTPPIRRREFLWGATATVPLASAEKADAAESTAADVEATGEHASADTVAETIRDAHSYLFATREGNDQFGNRTYRHWETPARGLGPGGKYRQTLYYTLLLERIGTREEAKRRCISYLLEERTDGGGWGDTATNFGALLLFELRDEYPAVREEIRAEIDERDQSLVPDVDAEDPELATDRTFDMRIMYAVLSTEYSYDELFPRNAPIEIGRLLSYTEPFDGQTISATGHMARPPIASLCAFFLLGTTASEGHLGERDQQVKQALERVMLSRRLSSGIWLSTMTTVFAVLALLELGSARETDDIVRDSLDWIAQNRVTPDGRVDIWRLPVWDTAKLIDSLHTSGVDADDPRLREAAQWLYSVRYPAQDSNPVATKLDRPMAPYRDQQGIGWGHKEFIYGDWDDTAIAIEALSPFLDSQLDEQAAFLRDVQNSDGSWSTYATDFAPFDDAEAERIRENVDDDLYRRFFGRNRSTDVTGGALAALGAVGDTVEDSQHVRDAVEWLGGARADNGMWVGLWGQAFTYATARVLHGLEMVGVDTDRPLVDGAAQALLERQNDDGGWGEDSRYGSAQSNPLNVPYVSAPSTPEQTGWALQALLAAGIDPETDAVRQGIDYLCRTQQSDGSWPVSLVMYNWGGRGYSTGGVTHGAVLKALGMYRKARQ